ncbi:MAG: rRNA cytosine-C5-methyltransferase [Massilibacteroides sp.]|nr:rRNA cytosine-C5-methyltransferase [Massilibacteroides sp.]MDD3063073.1 rRNA cytosine-C5-methyltransferase [Massilibacteroides sp.]MDD4115421.1 rRNA cytosine-C5-methyltransferase [Massilibacteroides sp.]MDD4660388.1 rRNA cytosine-C5-methyltransferase [Massilibacteroides sp.]
MELPVDFVCRTRSLLGNEYELFEAALAAEPPVSVRLNTRKGLLKPSSGTSIPWCHTGYYLPERLTFTFDPLFHAGGYYVQEASSMFLEQAVKTYIQKPVKCLDLCAAPGGKSTHLLDLLPEGSLLVSNEVIRTRSFVLSENITKWGVPNMIVTNDDPGKIGQLTHYFDVIVADVPCSGEGMFRKDPASRTEWSIANVELCASRQRRIILDVWEALKPGGFLIYSTCTYNTEENENNIHYFIEELGAEVLPLTVPNAWQISHSLKGEVPVNRFFPHKTKGEGFFLTMLRKKEDETIPIRLKTKTNKERKKEIVPEEFRQWLNEPEKFFFVNRQDAVQAFPLSLKADYILLTEKLAVVSAGVQLGEVKGKDRIPHPALAMSCVLNRASFHQTDLDWEDAIRFLRKEAVSLDAQSPKGFHLITYKDIPLGFVKQIGNRANNLYPTEWRIRSGYTPNEIKTLI